MDKIILPYRGKSPAIDPTAFIAPSAAVIGDVTIGAHSSVWFGAVVRGDFQPIRIGSNTLIGMGSIVMGYSEIGENVVIGAGTFLPQHKKIPANSLVFGSPAQIVRALRDDEIEALQNAAENYADLAAEYQKIIEELK